ncbi:MAG TPA: response regulator, partial [Tepidiformaceae bacterium]|nr:response regulator [Tepidiformaceae bacterium]
LGDAAPAGQQAGGSRGTTAGAGASIRTEHMANPEAPTILVVDDDDAVRTMLARLLEAQGYQVVAAENSDVALRLFEGGVRPDLVVSDVVLPGRSGIELRRILAELAPGLPVILVSGYSPEAPADFASKLPDTRFVAKPFAVEQLLTLVAETLGQRP